MLLGLPGTGKTYTLSSHQSPRGAWGASAVTSYTHSAVDTVMLKLAEAGVLPSMSIRLSSAASSVHKDIQPFMLDVDGCDAVKAATRLNAQAVLSTAGSVNGSVNSHGQCNFHYRNSSHNYFHPLQVVVTVVSPRLQHLPRP